MALLYFTKVSTCLSIAEVFAEASHDRLTRMLNGGWSGQKLLDRAQRVLFTVVSSYLIVDDQCSPTVGILYFRRFCRRN
jgi:hypothetical protein